MYSFRFLLILALLPLAACTLKPPVKNPAQYWQRINTSSMVYLRGPKAQELLNRGIAACITELRELERLGQIKNAIPTDPWGRVLGPDAHESDLARWDTPDHDGSLLAEHGNYHDFESCMRAKGWERTQYVPFETAQQSRKAYLQNHISYKYESTIGKNRPVLQTQKRGPYRDLNE